MKASSAKRSLTRSRSAASLLAVGTFLGGGLLAVAATLDYFGPPAVGDPSAWTGPIVSEALADALTDQPAVYKGAIEGGPTGTAADQGVTGTISEDSLDGGGKYNIPTDSKPSPLFGAEPYTQKMLRFEEFGTQPLDPTVVSTMTFPRPTVGSPDLGEQDLGPAGEQQRRSVRAQRRTRPMAGLQKPAQLRRARVKGPSDV